MKSQEKKIAPRKITPESSNTKSNSAIEKDLASGGGVTEGIEVGRELEITIPVYNEEESIFTQIELLYTYLETLATAYKIKIVIADNGSTDQTALIIKRLKLKYPNLKSITTSKPGVGDALKTSWRESKADFVGYMDLDFSTSLKHLKEVINILSHNKAEIVAGSRWLKDSKVNNRSIKRGISSYIFNMIMQKRFEEAMTDSMCGFKFMKKSLFDEIDEVFEMNSEWFFSAELMVFAGILKAERMEIPVLWNDDKNSKVKIPSLALSYIKAMNLLERKIKKFKIKNDIIKAGKDTNLKNRSVIKYNQAEKLNNVISINSSANRCQENTEYNSSTHPLLILGTANWGTRVNKETAYKITKRYYEQGMRCIDSSINYPIDNNQEHFGLALSWLSEFKIDFPEIKVYIKVCASTNEGDESNIINASYLELLSSYLESKFASNYLGLGIHWDNRDTEVSQSIEQENIIKLLEKYSKKGLIVGLSGIKNLSIYRKRENPWLLQVKYGITDADKVREELTGVSHIYAYGVWKNGMSHSKKVENDKYELKSENINIANRKLVQLIKEVISRGYCGIIFGVSDEEQLKVWMKSYSIYVDEVGAKK
jgi:glycosyltransferase involved in cell wall biosynthesis